MFATVVVLYCLKLGGVVSFPDYSLSTFQKVSCTVIYYVILMFNEYFHLISQFLLRPTNGLTYLLTFTK